MKNHNRLFDLIVLLIIWYMVLPLNTAAADPLFPNEIDQDKPDYKQQLEINTAVSTISFKSGNQDMNGIVVRPSKPSTEKLPPVLFVQIPDETPDAQMLWLRILASRGYIVMCIPWKNAVDIEEASRVLADIKGADPAKVSLIGVHQGGTQCITLACKSPKTVKAIVSIAAQPDYNSPAGDPALTLRVPILLIHGSVDTNVPVSVSQYFYYYLQDKGKIAPEIILLPNTRHYYNEAEWNQIMTEIAKFFDAKLKEIPPPQPAQ